ncbi:MAG TPA: diguanylate cyclase [Burkholderiaceae bacterium]|nr:diguanylate cyclase [Burkholderiaceae bacterium]
MNTPPTRHASAEVPRTGLNADWHQVLTHVPTPILATVGAVVAQYREPLATEFYSAMMADPEATVFLSHTAVHTRLHASIQRWMDTLFGGQHDDPDGMAALQRQVGEVHARAEIPVQLVSRGMRLLKTRLVELLVRSDLSRNDLVLAVEYVGGLMDLAFAEMSAAYVRSHEQGARTDETFRMVTAGQNAALERHKQLGALTEWENTVLRGLATGLQMGTLASLRSSAFGLWVQHKAPLLFDDSPELERIAQRVEHLDGTLLPLVVSRHHQPAQPGRSPDGSSVLRDFLADLEETRFLVNSMFDRLSDMEVGRDVLTQLYNRRFLPTIMRRELSLARRQENQFAVLMIDVDHFKRVNDTHGHETGDRVLQHIAALLMAHGRASDFFFRYGGEEFLAVVNEVDTAAAQQIAEKVRARVEQAEFHVNEHTPLKVTVSIGLAMHTGHPDYRHLINQADEALYRAKRSGRNQVCVAADTDN